MSGLFKSTLIKGNRITDFTQTTATVGVVIPFLYGRAPVDGNVIFAPLPPKENRTVKRQGKGGVKQESFTYTLSYAIAFCRGPIYGYWWIKRNGKIVYTNDPNAPLEDKEYAAKWLQKATFYYGTSSQLPDSTIESYKGSGNVSAFRYLAYIVVEDDDVTEGGGAVPSYEAVPMGTPPEAYLTSHPYAQYYADTVDVVPSIASVTVHDALWVGHEDEEVSYRVRITTGYLGVALLSYSADENISYAPTLVDGELKSQLRAFNHDENVSYAVSVTDGFLKVSLITYDQWSESVSYSPTLVDGELA